MGVKRVETQFESKTVSLETGKLAKQADGAVLVSVGESVVLVTAVASPSLREGIDFFPLTVDVEERVYSVGKIPGSVLRREGRPSEKATLTARLTDRPLRPSFPDWFRHEVQIIATVLQYDGENQFDAHCITGASAALLLGGVPFAGPIAGARVAHIRGRWVPFPTVEELEQATIELVVAGRVNDGGDVDIMMVEAAASEQMFRLIEQEGAPKPDEDVVIAGLEEAKRVIKQLCDLQLELKAQCPPTAERTWIVTREYGDDVAERVDSLVGAKLEQALSIVGKQERQDAIDAIKAEAVEALSPEFEGRTDEVKPAIRSLEKKIIRRRILTEGKRVDGRSLTEIRPLHTEVGLLSRLHGSGLFQRGETQVLSVVTLAMPRMEQFIGVDELTDRTKRYMHQYNFPPFSTGEAYPMRGPRRRDIGHGALAEKAVLWAVPPAEEFPYAVRVVSETLESNGSSSMASVCGSTLALMDAGVPLKAIVGGIAMGLIVEDGKFATLTDILGSEDGHGDMDFKVAGTEEFITALQLDTKVLGVPVEVLAQAMQQAKQARLEVISAMKQTIDRPRAEMSPYAPRIILEQIPVDKIGELIGPKGKTINDIVDRTGAQIDIEDDGRVLIGATDADIAAKALELVRSIVSPPQLEIGQEFEGTVVKTTEFGAFVSLIPGKDGLVHISKLGPKGKRINKVEEVVKVGDKLWVKINEIRPDGKLNLVPVRDASSESESETEDANV